MSDDIIKVNDLIKIEKLEMKSGGYSLTLSDKSEPIMISSLMVAKYRLKTGIVITKPQLLQLVDEAANDQCNNTIRRILATRDHSSGEVKNKLLQRGFELDVITRVIKEYENKGLIDDSRFAQHLALRTFERKPCGYAYLMASLQRKMIPRSVAENVISMVLSENDEVKTAESALAGKWRSWQKFDLETTRKKAYNYLSRRGIGYQAARQAFENLISKSEKED